MATKRKVDEIMKDTMPGKSKEDYIKAWKSFMEFVGKQRIPGEEDYIQYFDHLHEVKEYAASTIWKIYSMLSYMHQQNYNTKLQNLTPKLTQLCKSYNAGYERKCASLFTKEELQKFLENEALDEDPFWVIRKAIASVYFSGGLRSAGVVELEFSNMVDRGDTYVFKLKRKKQTGGPEESMFVVPTSLYRYLNNYINGLRIAIDEVGLKGRLFKGTPKFNHTTKAKYVNQNMGKVKIANVGVDVATLLKLDNPKRYTGHCFRRSAATFAADGGATTTEMKRHFGWKNEKTAQRYVNMSSKGAESMAEVIQPGTSGALVVPGASSIPGPSGVNVGGALSVQSSVTEQRDNTVCSKVYNINCAGAGDGVSFTFN